MSIKRRISRQQIPAAYRGLAFEEELQTTHEAYRAAGLALITKHEVRRVRRADGTLAYAAKSITDYTGIVRGGRFVAFDAKSLQQAEHMWRPDRRQLHQLEYLLEVYHLGGIAFYLVRNGPDEARLVHPTLLQDGSADLTACPAIPRTYSPTPWDWLPAALTLPRRTPRRKQKHLICSRGPHQTDIE